MAANNKTQMVLRHDNSIIVSNDQQAPVTSARQRSSSFIQLSLNFAFKSRKSHVVLLAAFVDFWATVCKTVRPVLSDRCLSGLSVLSVLSVCLSVTLVYCGQTVGWIKMKLGVQVGLGPDDFVLDGDPASPPQKGWVRSSFPNFRPMSIVAKRLDGSTLHLVWRWALVQATLC